MNFFSLLFYRAVYWKDINKNNTILIFTDTGASNYIKEIPGTISTFVWNTFKLTDRIFDITMLPEDKKYDFAFYLKNNAPQCMTERINLDFFSPEFKLYEKNLGFEKAYKEV